MSEEKVMYTDLKFPNTKKQKEKRHQDQKRREKGYGACQGKWSCCGEKCYYFSEKEHTWEDSDKLCKDLGSSLIKIDNKEEQNFIQLKLKYNYWIGLSRKGAQYPWTWQDGSQLSQSLSFQPAATTDAKCGLLKPASISNAGCIKYFKYICEKNFTCLAISKN
uniref:C-type lectin domain family 9 member A-like n=1 Tax=Castor canadensis TaxID=51338 RepID=A0A8B7TIQ4_CASCN|nr:C-type lectin domain family 9 member A-like [Castor canadensis]